MELIHEDDESKRLQDLNAYAILDTMPEYSFDQLTTLAAKICHTPIALLSFIDEKRQWFKSTHGIELKEIPRHLSACNQTIKQEGIYEIKDSEHGACPYKEYMMSLGLRYYAGVPIISRNGHNVGTLCVIDRIPRQLTAEQILTLQILSDEIVQNLEIRKKYQENLEKLNDLGSKQLLKDKKLLDVAYQKSHRAIAEISAGVNYRIRPFILNIQMNTRLLLKENQTPENLARLKSIDDSSRGVADILDKLEKFVTAEKEKWMKLVDLNGILTDVLEHLQGKIQVKNINLTVNMDPEMVCVGNYSKLFETFYSIIHNAIDAVSGNGEGIIDVALKHEARRVIILITDNGHGIEEQTRPFIFQPFFTTKNRPSLGISLALAKSHMEEHWGTLELENPGHPTTFKITIPTPA